MSAAWDEGKHPRYDRGVREGGRFRGKAEAQTPIEFGPEGSLWATPMPGSRVVVKPSEETGLHPSFGGLEGTVTHWNGDKIGIRFDQDGMRATLEKKQLLMIPDRLSVPASEEQRVAMSVWRGDFANSSNMRAYLEDREMAPAFRDDQRVKDWAGSIRSAIDRSPGTVAPIYRIVPAMDEPHVGQPLKIAAASVATRRGETLGFRQSFIVGADRPWLYTFPEGTKAVTYPDGQEGIVGGDFTVRDVSWNEAESVWDVGLDHANLTAAGNVTVCPYCAPDELCGLHIGEVLGTAWDESRHPREDRGRREGGRFRGGVRETIPTVYLADSVNGGHVAKPGVFIRFGDLPVDESGVPLPSMNGLTGERELGLSVYPAWHDPKTGLYVLPSGSEQYIATQGEIQERPAFLVRGVDSGNSGDDGEPLLDPQTVKIDTQIPGSQIVNESTPNYTFDGEEIDQEDAPDWTLTAAAARPSAASFQAAADRARFHVETLEPTLAIQYERVLRAAGVRAAAQFRKNAALVAAAGDDIPNWTVPPVDSLVDVVQVTQDLLGTTAETREAAAIAATRPIMSAMGVSFSLEAPLVKDLVGRTGVRAAKISIPGLRDAVIEAMTQAFAEGLSVDQAAEAILEKTTGLADYQATMLARTDLIGTANGGSILAAKVVYPTGTIVKRWVNATNSDEINDGRIRPSHMEANGQTVPLDGYFVVGGDRLLYPGDPSGADEEVINCRCTLVYDEPLSDINAAAWDESKHPREGAGRREGGRFAKIPDTAQQKAILRQSPTARRMREKYPPGTRVFSHVGDGEPIMEGTIVRHVPGTNAQGGHFVVEWDNGITGNTGAMNLGLVDVSEGMPTQPADVPSAGVDDTEMRDWIRNDVEGLRSIVERDGTSPEDATRIIAGYEQQMVDRYHEEYDRGAQTIGERLNGMAATVSARPPADSMSLSDPDGRPGGVFSVGLPDDPNTNFTVWTDSDGSLAEWQDGVGDVLDVTDPDFFGDDAGKAGRYIATLRAVRGDVITGNETLYRGMSGAERAAWDGGASIPAGKFFTSEPTANMAQDVAGEFPELHAFEVARNDSVETDPGVFQLIRPATLKDGRIAADHGDVSAAAWDERKHPRYERGQRLGGKFAPKAGRGYVPARATDSAEMQALRDDFGANPEPYWEGTSGDGALGAIAKIQGFDGLPEVVSAEELDRRIAGGSRELWRGMAGGAQYEEDIANMAELMELPTPEFAPGSGAQRAQAFRNGEYYPGSGTWGNGTYTAGGESGSKVAVAYAEPWSPPQKHPQLVEIHDPYKAPLSNPAIVRMALRPDASVANGPTIRREWATHMLADETPNRGQVITKSPALALDSDLGRYAAARGYDAIDLDDGTGFFILLNRTAVAVQEAGS